MEDKGWKLEAERFAGIRLAGGTFKLKNNKKTNK